MLDISVYHVLKEKGAISMEKNASGDVFYTIKQFDSLTGKEIDPIKNIISSEDITKLEKQIKQAIQIYQISLKNYNDFVLDIENLEVKTKGE